MSYLAKQASLGHQASWPGAILSGLMSPHLSGLDEPIRVSHFVHANATFECNLGQ